jgi:hypothetical protein
MALPFLSRCIPFVAGKVFVMKLPTLGELAKTAGTALPSIG